jgi:hypothetical protein
MQVQGLSVSSSNEGTKNRVGFFMVVVLLQMTLCLQAEIIRIMGNHALPELRYGQRARTVFSFIVAQNPH